MLNKRKSNPDEMCPCCPTEPFVSLSVRRNNGSLPTFPRTGQLDACQSPYKLCSRAVERSCAVGGGEEVNGKVAQHQD